MYKLVPYFILLVFQGFYLESTAQFNLNELIVCGWDEVFILDLSTRNQEYPEKVWSWSAQNRTDLPEKYRSQFNSTDECKPVDQGKNILVTSSGGGVALIQRASGAVLFYASVPNAHSADLLPNSRVAVAASRNPQGNQIMVYDLDKPDEVLIKDTLTSGHGVVWDRKRQVLWALGYAELKAYQLKNWESSTPELSLLQVFKLPEAGGHDLYPVPKSNEMTITTSNHCWLFDRETATFRLHPSLSEKKAVKGISINPGTNQLIYIQADTSWWSENLRFLNPDLNLYYDNQHFYKARWNVAID